MISKELKKLNRRELVDVIYKLKKNEEQMQAKIEELEKAVQDKRIRLSVAGSIADAATSITGVFSTAQMTADLYLSEISCMKAESKKECDTAIKAAEQKAEEILAEAKKQHSNLVARYKSDYLKWQQLQAEIKLLEERKKEISEG